MATNFASIIKTFAQKELPNSEVELAGDVPFEAILPYQDHALKHIAESLDLPGFRKGHVPTDIALKKVGEIAVLEEAVELFMRDFYPELVDTLKIDAVGRPDIRITKLAPGNPVGITVHTTTYPTVELPKNWKTIAQKVEIETVADVLDAEVDEALTSIRRAHAKSNQPASESTPTSEVPPEQLPELNDTFAQSLGSFTDLADLKTKLKENIKMEKEQKAKEKRRGSIIDALLEKTSVAVPTIFVESELEKIMNQLREDISRFGLSFEDYLKRMEKTEQQVRDDFRDQATKRAKLQLTLNKLAEEEKIEADKDAVEKEFGHAMEHFPDARPELVRVHIETVLRNEKVFEMLESKEEKK